jgi:hypothetical protein
MSQADLDVNRHVRTVLVRHWIDLGRIAIRSMDGKLWIHGSLHRIGGVNEELTASIVQTMFEEIKRIRNVRHILANLDNWTNDSGAWQPIGGAHKAPERHVAPPSGTVYDIGKDKGHK